LIANYEEQILMKVLYLIQTHKNPEQIYRLIQTIRKLAPTSYILVCHNFTHSNLDVTSLQNLPEVKVISSKRELGNFSIIQEYLEVIGWLLSNVEFDWLINLTGQDYPTQPLSQLEKFLLETQYDGFLEYFEAFSDLEPKNWRGKEGRDRYLYNYWRLYRYLPRWQRALIKLPRIFVNNTQPFVRIKLSYGLMLGVRTTSPFNEKFLCYAGSYFHILSRKCIQYLYDFSKLHPNLISYYRNKYVPDESLIQSILVNSKLFNLCNDNKRYINWGNTEYDGPRILTVKDYSVLSKDDIYFARKLDMSHESEILDMLDARIF
jgi:hypothetical protein